jgi:3-dehydroquinate synthetase
LSHKVAVIRTLVGRAGALCSSGTQKTTELSHVEKVLRRNHYPARVIERYSKEKEAKTITDDNDRFKATITLPYVRGTSEAIKTNTFTGQYQGVL